MITLEEARDYALSLPATGTVQKFGREHWAVFDKTFAWHRPFSKADIKRFGDRDGWLAKAPEDLAERFMDG